MKHLFSITFLANTLFFIGCSTENPKFKIKNDSLGLLTKNTKVTDLETIFAEDSIVTSEGIPKLNTIMTTETAIKDDSVNKKKGIIDPDLMYQKIEVFEKGGLHLLSLTPTNDSTATIENIRVYDPRYTTEKGLHINSTFKDIKEKYAIKKIITSMNNVVILLKESGLYFTIDKKELPESLRYDASLNIEEVQIPDAAKIKYMMLAWE
ncbi:hypothetical protein [Cellulophaga sp. Hel_I_12]|uniref:hypothetical protein n=1 Tax=Cellulophaga sp. Hel_I_12 TaxID=1249972 RepID=UPI0006465B37|nr:hypothetical protein [Cellulophaga sp. Hel_I_12]